MDCFFAQKKTMAVEQNVFESEKSSSFLLNKPMVLPEPIGSDALGSSCIPLASITFKNPARESVNFSSSAATHSRAFSAPSQLCRSNYDRLPHPAVVSGESNNSFYKKSFSFSISSGSKNSPVPLPVWKQKAHPLPVPFPQKSSKERSSGEAYDKSLGFSTALQSNSGGVAARLNGFSDAHRLPLPWEVLEMRLALKMFSYEELSAGCQEFSSCNFLRETPIGPAYRCLVNDPQASGVKMTVSVTCLRSLHLKDEDELISSVAKLAQMENPYLCKLRGFCNLASTYRKKDNRNRMLVFEYLGNKSLDRVLFEKKDDPSISLFTRLKIALGTAKGLAYLCGKYSSQGLYEDFNMSNVQLDRDYNPKLSDYGLLQLFKIGISISTISHDSCDLVSERSAVEKTIVGSFGKVLLGLLSAWKYLEKLLTGAESSVQLVKAMLNYNSQIKSLLHPVLQGPHVARPVKKVINLALQCLNENAVLRPQLQDVVKILTGIQNLQSFDLTTLEKNGKGKINGDNFRTTYFEPKYGELCMQPMYELPSFVEDTSLQDHKSSSIPKPLPSEGQPPPEYSRLSMSSITVVPPTLGYKQPASPNIIKNFSCSSSLIKERMGLGRSKHKVSQSIQGKISLLSTNH